MTLNELTKPQTLIYKAGQFNKDKVKLIRAKQAISVQGKEQIQEM